MPNGPEGQRRHEVEHVVRFTPTDGREMTQVCTSLEGAIRAVPELIESSGIHKQAEAVDSASVQDGGNDGLFERSSSASYPCN